MNTEKIGLVLSGGGTKGVAHAGVLLFLEQKNIDIDVLACCSAGSIVGCLHVMGKSPKEILDFFKSIYFFNWKHFTFNQSGLVSSSIFKHYLEPIFKDMQIKDLPKTVKIVATELVSGTERIFEDDFKVMDAIIASCSVPGVATPFVYEEEIFCDGGILNNFPADIIREDCDKLIGVYVSPLQEVKFNDLHTIKSIISRSYDLLSYRIETKKFHYCDWFISSKDLSNYGAFERKGDRLEQIFEIGFHSAQASFDDSLFNKKTLQN